MMSRLLMVAILLGITIGLPYLASRLSVGSGAPTTVSNTPSPGAESAAQAVTGQVAPSAAQLALNGPDSLLYASPASLEGTRFNSVEQVLRFDVTKDWVYRNWARKSTGPTDVGLFAVRVPLVTGTQMTALAGSLTYFFNAQGEVEHIAFRGRTGDATELVNYLGRTYAFRWAPAPAGQQLYQVKRGQRVQSELRTRPESVLWTTAPHSSIAVELELARPGTQRYLPPRAPDLEIPRVASTSVSTVTNGEGNKDPGGSNVLQSFWEKMRRATSQEQGQVLWKRWPN